MRRVTARSVRRRAAGAAASAPSASAASAASAESAESAASALRATAGLLLVLALLLLLAPGCGEKPSAGAGDVWPLTLQDQGLLAYAALTLPAQVQSDLLRGLLGWEPAGLREDAPLVVVHLDEKTYGGPVALLLPVADRKAFHASLESCDALQQLGGGRWRYDVPPDSPLRAISFVLARLRGGSPLEMLASLADAPQTSFGFELADEGGHVLVAPSFEATGACRNVVRATDGFVSTPPHAFVASLDLTRLRLVYAEQIADSESQLRAALSGAGAAGALGGMLGDGHGGAGGGLSLPVNWELLWALKDMLAFGDAEALQFHADASPAFWEHIDRLAKHDADGDTGDGETDDDTGDGETDDDAGGDEAAERDGRERRDEREERDEIGGLDDGAPGSPSDGRVLFESLPELGLRVQLAADAPLRAVAAAGAPAPAIDGALLVLAADAPRFAPAFAHWCRPIAEVVKGRGPPAERYLDELSRLVGAWGGLLALVPASEDSLLLVGSLAPGRALEADAWRQWLGPLLTTARVEGFGGELVTEERADGVHLLHSADGGVAASYRVEDDLAWAALGEVGAVPDAALSAFRAALVARASGAPAPDVAVTSLRLALADAEAQVSVHGGHVELTLRPAARER
jgi:hypothetical protein